MVEAAAGRRSGTNRRRPSGGGERRRQQQQHQRLVAVAVAARVVMVAPTPAPAVGGGGSCIEDILGCLLGMLRALGVTWATRPQRQPRLAPQPPRGPAPGADGRRVAAELRGIPGRIAGNGACAVASLYTLQGKKGVNQDAMIVWENFCSREDTIFCGVFDGHGPYGHLVAKRVRDLLPIKLGVDLGTDEGRQTSTSNIRSNGDEIGSPENMDRDAEQNGEYPEIFTALRTSFLRAFHVMDRDLKLHKNIDCFFSGTTAVAVLKQGRDLIIGNLGDSRAILGTRDKDNQLMAVQLTVDLKPNIPSPWWTLMYLCSLDYAIFPDIKLWGS
ncbi:hypothetical protein E2562_038619 [Oryza meyeriana var. granulata]|uniref:protein-serine/threonine phosphatase n=1 Tax=Oryza meyeriana var. granulata TaxID=110450 RepID=A0A6G1FGN7_9ORYZ|nr:hypothetical protein E2562_038619 [Oryza meyeriana var. granulata]